MQLWRIAIFCTDFLLVWIDGHVFVMEACSATSLEAPTTGALTGILFFQDRSITSTSQNTISGGGAAVFQGALYFATTPLVYSGGSGVSTAYSILVADTITISGTSTTTVNANYASLSGGSPIKSDALYE